MNVLLDVSPLREHRDFRLLWIGQAVTFVGSMVTYVAVPYQLYDLTGSTTAVGALGAVEFVAMMATAFLGGALADAMDRRRMVRITEVLMLTASALLLGNALLRSPSVVGLYVLMFCLVAAECLQRPSLDALLPRLVPREQLVPAAALGNLRMTVGAIAGPALGGVLISAFGIAATYAVDVATFAVSLTALWLMRAVPPPPEAERPSVRGVLEGIAYARSRPELIGTYLVDINATFWGMPNALFPALATGLGGPSVLGLLYSAPFVGAMLASATSAWCAKVHRQGLGVLWAAGLWGAALVMFGLSSTLWLSLLCLALAGAADMVSGVFRSTIWNTTIPDHLRGRLAGIELISYGSGPSLGNLEAGGVAALTSPRVSAGLGGVLCVVGTVALAAALPEFRRYDSRELEAH
jgi:MFS family permease